MFKFWFGIFLLPVVIFIYKLSTSDGDKTPHNMVELQKNVFGTKGLPEGCTIVPFKSTLALLRYEVSKDVALKSKDGFFNS